MTQTRAVLGLSPHILVSRDQPLDDGGEAGTVALIDAERPFTGKIDSGGSSWENLRKIKEEVLAPEKPVRNVLKWSSRTMMGMTRLNGYECPEMGPLGRGEIHGECAAEAPTARMTAATHDYK